MLTEKAIEKIDNFIRRWDYENPIDFFWRQHFNIPFGDVRHLSTNFIDQQIWFEELKVIDELKKSKGKSDDDDVPLSELSFKTDESGKEIITFAKTGKKKEVVKTTQEEIDRDFENFDYSKFYDLEKIEKEITKKPEDNG